MEPIYTREELREMIRTAPRPIRTTARYWLKVFGDDEKPVTILRLTVGPRSATMQFWRRSTCEWEEEWDYWRRIGQGDMDINEITEEQARELYPEAFKEPLPGTVRPEVDRQWAEYYEMLRTLPEPPPQAG